MRAVATTRKGAYEPMVRLVIADDHPVVRAGLRAVFETDTDLRVVEEIASGADVLDRVQHLWPAFDLLVLDARMPRFDPVATVRQLTQMYDDLKIMVLSSYDNSEYVNGLLNAGARGYVLKDEPRATLISAVHIIVNGDTYMSPKIASVYVQQQRRLIDDRNLLLELTDREREVLQLVGAGYDNQEIGNALTISYETVKNHLRNIYGKLGIGNRYQAIVFAFRNGIVDLQSIGQRNGSE